MEFLHLSFLWVILAVLLANQPQPLERAMKMLLLASLLSATISIHAQDPVSCLVSATSAQSSFYHAIDSQVNESSTNLAVKEKISEMKRIFSELSNELCAIESSGGFKSEAHSLKEEAQIKLQKTISSGGVPKGELHFLEVIHGIFSRTITRL